ncbi:nicotinate phosphoribosyltransferase [Ornithinimicrobium sufpigmenti]|uniref:nicotinate phosphoribosyltransferase n=1 Tax=Ornithinimicrobium sufpigmenti TaxID=2508882 RepID=UPI00103690A8|nr:MULTISPECIES: nicotinate phosphoribosyltransferase [unclassified Ornithinimicrobium]
MGTSTALKTDRYELTMLSTLIESGRAEHPAVFELFARRLPAGRRFGLLAGLGRLLEELDGFRFDADELDWLAAEGVITPAVARYLADWRFTADIDAYPEGSVYWPHSPVVQVRGRLGDGLVLETLALSILNHDTAVASAAARMVLASGGRPIIEMGSRRVHEDAAIAAARAAYVAGFSSTSNLAAGRRYGVPTVGTAAHAFTLAHGSEMDAFRAQIATHGTDTTLLVDTYDIEQGISNAVAAAREAGAPGPRAVRLDSGDLEIEARRVRDLLDSLGAWCTWITVTSDIDEYAMTALAAAPIDGYGAGTRVATGSGHPTAGFVYKLVAVADSPAANAPLRPVAKKAAGKGSTGGRKTVYRHGDGTEHWTLDGTIPTGTSPVPVPVVRAGRVVHRPTLEQVREYAAGQLAALPHEARAISDGQAYRSAAPAPQHENPPATQAVA